MRFRYLSAWVVFIAPLVAQQPGTQRCTPAPALTIYNQEFAVVRDQIRLDLKAGTSHVQFSGVTAYLEPDSVMLRNCSGKRVPRPITIRISPGMPRKPKRRSSLSSKAIAGAR